jgi:hypothetical protein
MEVIGWYSSTYSDECAPYSRCSWVNRVMILAVARSVKDEGDTASAVSSDVLGQSGNSGGVKYAEQSVSDPRVRGFSRDEGRWSGSSLTTVGCRLKLTTLESTDQKGVSLAVVVSGISRDAGRIASLPSRPGERVNCIVGVPDRVLSECTELRVSLFALERSPSSWSHVLVGRGRG